MELYLKIYLTNVVLILSFIMIGNFMSSKFKVKNGLFLGLWILGTGVWSAVVGVYWLWS